MMTQFRNRPLRAAQGILRIQTRQMFRPSRFNSQVWTTLSQVFPTHNNLSLRSLSNRFIGS